MTVKISVTAVLNFFTVEFEKPVCGEIIFLTKHSHVQLIVHLGKPSSTKTDVFLHIV